MSHRLNARTTRVAAVLVLALMLAMVVAGCKGNSAETPAPAGSTAAGGIAVAQSVLSTTAPDARLLLVQTAMSVTSTGTPVWAYLFGSPANDTTYVVYVSQGAVMSASEYGTAGLSAEEWPKVPTTTAFKVDSDAAYKKAVEAAGLEGTPGYSMGLVTYIPEAETSDVSKTFVWYVTLEPSGEATASVVVDANSGEAVVE